MMRKGDLLHRSDAARAWNILRPDMSVWSHNDLNFPSLTPSDLLLSRHDTKQ